MSVNPGNSIERRFTSTLYGLLHALEIAVDAAKTPQDIVRLLTRYSQSPEYKEWCDRLALTITTQVNKGVSSTWREAAKKAGRGSEIYTAIQQYLKSQPGGEFYLKVRENASLIKTFPLDMAREVTNRVSEEAIHGRRSGDILKDLESEYYSQSETLNYSSRV